MPLMPTLLKAFDACSAPSNLRLLLNGGAFSADAIAEYISAPRASLMPEGLVLMLYKAAISFTLSLCSLNGAS